MQLKGNLNLTRTLALILTLTLTGNLKRSPQKDAKQAISNGTLRNKLLEVTDTL